MSEKKSKEDTYSYKGWLNSDSFFKRAFAVLGYSWLATMIIYVILLGVIFVLALIFGLTGLISGA